MDVKYKNLTETASFKKLSDLEKVDLKKILTAERIEKCSIPAGATLAYNYAAKPADNSIVKTLAELSQEQQVIEKYKKILYGHIMNPGENRMVLHHHTRGNFDTDISPEAIERGKMYRQQVEKIADFAEKVHSGSLRGSTGAKFDTAVQIGIGGSDLGPRALYLALKGYVTGKGNTPYMKGEFISNVDPDDAVDVMGRINPESTLFIVVSKSGTTQETLTNNFLVKQLATASGIKGFDISKHLLAVTAKDSPMASSPGFLESFYIDDFIGGRYSATSAVGGVILSLTFGADIFKKFLDGAHHSDVCALENDALKNASLMDALLSVYDRNVLGMTAEAILPYSQALSRFPAHLQQLMMESNGKSFSLSGKSINYSTCPVIFGEPGTNGQHSFYQQLHQGTDIVPLKFIGFSNSQAKKDIDFEGSTSQKKLNANLAAQITAFALGQESDNLNKNFQGYRGSDLITAERLTPENLGALLAHFENKTMFQGFLWNINSFDQEGVQLGKKLAMKVLLSDKSGDEVLDAFSKLIG